MPKFETSKIAELNRVETLVRNTNTWTSGTVIASMVVLMIAAVAFFVATDSSTSNLMKGLSIAAMVLVLIDAMAVFSVYWYRSTARVEALGLDGYLVLGQVQSKASHALIITLGVFIATFQIYSVARITPKVTTPP